MTDLADFLLARIAEDESAANEATVAPWGVEGRDLVSPGVPLGMQGAPIRPVAIARLRWGKRDGEHIIRWDPARVLAECIVKRRIIGVYKLLEKAGAGTVLALLALPHAGHPDYREEWRP